MMVFEQCEANQDAQETYKGLPVVHLEEISRVLELSLRLSYNRLDLLPMSLSNMSCHELVDTYRALHKYELFSALPGVEAELG